MLSEREKKWQLMIAFGMFTIALIKLIVELLNKDNDK